MTGARPVALPTGDGLMLEAELAEPEPEPEPAHHAAGDVVVVRDVWQGRIRSARPMTVVVDDETLLALYLAVGTRVKRRASPADDPVHRLTVHERFAREEIELSDVVWEGLHALELTRPGEGRTHWALWDETWRFLGWRVSMQAPYTRTAVGFDSADHVLDLAVTPDLQWRWRDEEEFGQARAAGIFDRSFAHAILAEAQQAVDAIESRAWPYDAGYETFRPRADWPRAELGPDWAQL